jgi:hypothetical protein
MSEINSLQPSIDDERLQVLLAEYAQFKASERASRDHLYKINTLAAAVTSGLFVAIINYQLSTLTLIAPFVIYLVGFLYSTESLRLLRLSAHIKDIELAVRSVLAESGKSIPQSFEDRERYRSLVATSASIYCVVWLLFMYLLVINPYDKYLRIGLLISYSVVGLSTWAYDLWTNRKYMFPNKSKST